MKDTMNSRDIARFHKLILKNSTPAQCSKLLKVSVKTLKLFTPEKMKEIEKAKKAAIEKRMKEKLELADKAEIIAAATVKAVSANT